MSIIYYLKVFQIILCILITIGILLQYTKSDILSNASINKSKEVINYDLFETNISKFIILCISLFVINSLTINNLSNHYKSNQNLLNIKYNTTLNADDSAEAAKEDTKTEEKSREIIAENNTATQDRSEDKNVITIPEAKEEPISTEPLNTPPSSTLAPLDNSSDDQNKKK
jgi:protein translocase SecG subunit